MEQTQSFGPILILLVLIVSFLYMHFTNGSGLTRIYLAGAIVLAAILILLPSLNIIDLPELVQGGIWPNQNSAWSRLAGRDASADAGEARRGGEDAVGAPRR